MSFDFNQVVKQQLQGVAAAALLGLGASLLFSLLENEEETELEVELIPPEDVPKYQFKLDRAKIVMAQKRHEKD